MSTLNLTQHAATAEQLAVGVIDLDGDDLKTLRGLLTFDTRPTGQDVADRAHAVADLAVEATHGCESVFAMIGGAPFLMSALENALIERGITPLYAFSVRKSVETVQADGTVVKTAIFAHAGFVQI